MTDFDHFKARSLLMQGREEPRIAVHFVQCEKCMDWVNSGMTVDEELEKFNERAICMEVRVALLDAGGVPPDEYAAIEQHLKECEVCALWDEEQPIDDELRQHRDFGGNMPTEDDIKQMWEDAKAKAADE